ncbi:MAG TPA: 4Fe-4S binding protein [Polyangiaceae bacterium]
MTPFKSLSVRASQGTQYITDLRKAVPNGFRGRPSIAPSPCATGCAACRDVCPTRAIGLGPVSIDLGRCVFCSACVEVCPEHKIAFTPDPKMGSTAREDLIIAEGEAERVRVRASAGFSKVFGRSLKMRQVSAGGCNACELEMSALANVNFDLQRFGIEWVASPRHADALVLTGPLTRAMKNALRLAWDAMPEPRFVVAVGACAISGGLYDGATGVDRTFLEQVGPSLYVPGCPPHPLTFVNAILDFLGIA